MADYYTSADPEGLHPKGWYPGKKHGVLKRALQVGTMGIYNPDDRFASEVNKKRIVARASAEEGVNKTKMQHAAELEAITNNLLKYSPGMSPEAAAQAAAGYFATQVQAGMAANKASAANSNVIEAEQQGALPGAGKFGAARMQSATDTAQAVGANARNQSARAAGAAPAQGDLGMLDAELERAAQHLGIDTNNNASRLQRGRAARNVPENQAENESANLDLANKGTGIKRREMELGSDIFEATKGPNFNSAVSTADANAAKAAAQQRVFSDPSRADSITTADVNRQTGLTLPPYTTAIVPIPVGGTNRLEGIQYPRGFQPTETITEEDLKSGTKRVVRKPLGASGVIPPSGGPMRIPLDEFNKLTD